MAEEIIFFDLPSRPPCKTWSLNLWKTRFVLNYKNLPYRTEWLEYPDIQPRLSPHLPPNPEGTPYTIPTIRLSSGEYVMDSRKIADVLEEKHPSPSLRLDSPYQAKVDSVMPLVMTQLAGIYVALIPQTMLNDASIPYWNKSRAAWLGEDIATFAAKNGGEKAWEEFAPTLRQVTGWLKENPGGPFFLGTEVSYADFVWAGFLICSRRIEEKAIFQELLKRSGDASAHEALLEGLEKWAERDDH